MRTVIHLALLILFGHAATAAASGLADAVEHRDPQAVDRLLANPLTRLDAAQPDGMTALHWAVLREDVALAKRLLAAGANADAATRYGVTSLAIACRNGDALSVKALLAAGADPKRRAPTGETPLMIAARTGRPRAIGLLLAAGAEPDRTDRSRQTALMWAAAAGNTEAVSMLLAEGADHRTPLGSGFTPLFFAIREGHIDTTRRLLAAGLDVNQPMQRTTGNKAKDPPISPLLLAVENGHFELAVALLELGADPNAAPAGHTALHALTWVRRPLRGDGNPAPPGSGKIDGIAFARRLLEDFGAKVDPRRGKKGAGRGRLNPTGATPFFLAAHTADLPLMRLLLEFGADPHSRNADGCTALAAAAGVDDLGSGLLPAGTEQEALAAVRLLIEQGVDPNVVDKNRETAMHGAAYASRPRMVELLAAAGADPGVWNRKNRYGWTPLMIAQGHRHGNFQPSPETTAAVKRAFARDSPSTAAVTD